MVADNDYFFMSPAQQQVVSGKNTPRTTAARAVNRDPRLLINTQQQVARGSSDSPRNDNKRQQVLNIGNRTSASSRAHLIDYRGNALFGGEQTTSKQDQTRGVRERGNSLSTTFASAAQNLLGRQNNHHKHVNQHASIISRTNSVKLPRMITRQTRPNQVVSS